MTRRATVTALAVSAFCWPGTSSAQVATPAPPADFAAAAAACIDAASPDKLDTGKLVKRDWVKQGDDRAPFGAVAIFTHSASISRIFASPTPGGYCIVDGYGAQVDQFDVYKAAVAARLTADHGTSGASDVAVGKPGSDDRRQGFVIGNAVAAYSAVLRAGGLNLRFTVMNAKFAGNPQMFQTSRPPLSEAEMAENGAKNLKDLDYARGNASAQDLVANVRACAAALRSNAPLPAEDGWRKSIHASGTPRSVDALKTRDMNAILAGMANTRQLLYRAGGHRGLITKYFVRGVHNVCEATVFVDPANAGVVKAETIAALGLGTDGGASGKAKGFADEYMLADLTRTWKWEQSELALRQGHGTGVDRPDPAKTTISVIVF